MTGALVAIKLALTANCHEPGAKGPEQAGGHTMRTLFKILAGFAVIVASGTLITHLRPKVPRAALGIAADETQRCEAPKLSVYPKNAYQRRVAANDYLAYAVASLNAYNDGTPKGVSLEKHSPEWRSVGTWDKGGLAFRVYHRDEPDRLSVLTVMRGTESLDISDWLADFSWLLAWLPIETQYDEARLVFQATRKQAYEAAKGRKVSFLMSGHSLGGGIARHIAHSYPCVSAAVFDSSIVEHRYRLAEPYTPLIVNTFQEGDELTRAQRLFFDDSETATYKPYRQDVIKDKTEFMHSITGLAVGMARQVLACQERRAECPVPHTDTRARTLYCQSWGKDSKLCKAG
jgi:hypothetical protein